MGATTLATACRPACRKRSSLNLAACGSSVEKMGRASNVLRAAPRPLAP